MEDIEKIINSILRGLMKKIDMIEKLKVKEYEAMLCDYIEKIKNETEEKERLKCFGGNCVLTYNPIREQKKHSVRYENFSQKVIEEINAEIILYFKDINEKWIRKIVVITTKMEKFDTEDVDTMEFIIRMKSREQIEHKINF